MSILDHNQNYDVHIKEYTNDMDDLPDGKFFWFSGYEPNERYIQNNDTFEYETNMNTNIENGQMYEEDVQYPHTHVDNVDILCDNSESVHVNEQNDLVYNGIESPQHCGTYFKLNGSIPDTDSEEDIIQCVVENNVFEKPFPDPPEECLNNNTQEHNIEDGDADDELDDYAAGGMWFGFAGRQRRAQSLENLLADKTLGEDTLTEQFKLLDQLVMESFDDLDFGLDPAEPDEQINTPQKLNNGKEDVIIEKEVHADETEPGIPTYHMYIKDKENKDEQPKPTLNLDEMLEEKNKVLNEFIDEVFVEKLDSSMDEKEIKCIKRTERKNYKNQKPASTYKPKEPSSAENDHHHFNVYSPTQRVFLSGRESPEVHNKVNVHSPDTNKKTRISVTSKPKTKLAESVFSQDEHEVKVFYQVKNYNSSDSINQNSKMSVADQNGSDFIDSFLAQEENVNPEEENIVAQSNSLQYSEPVVSDKIPHSLKRQNHIASSSGVSRDDTSVGDFSSSEDEKIVSLHRNRSFRRSIVIEDEEGLKRLRRSTGGTCVSVFFTPISPKKNLDIGDPKQTVCQQFKDVLTYLDHMVVSEVNFGKDFEAVKKLHALFWEVKEGEMKKKNNSESVSSVLNYLVVQEWPKIILGCLRKLKSSYPHVFQQCSDVENIIYYSGHMPSLLRMNRTSSEFAVSVIFDGLLKAAINFTDSHEASREASCEDNLIGYLLEEIVPKLHNVQWGKVTAREMFFKSICDLVYNCAQTPSNASYLIEHDCVNIFTEMREETFDIVDARKVNMTMLLSLSFLIDDNNYDVIIPREDSIIRILQFLDKSLEHSEHTYHDFKAVELTNCISWLAGHNVNKVLITRNSGQEILHKLLKYAYTDEERVAACNALWNVAFSREAKDILREMGKLMNLLRDLRGSENAVLRRSASGILWECEEKYDIKGNREMCATDASHVMISYEYEAQPLVIGIRDELHRHGYKVWMNTDGEERSLQEIMTRGVERASVVIAAVTRKYKQTPHSFAEVDYAHKLRKLVIPVIIDVDFVPDGWLNELIQFEKTFDFSRRSMFNGSLDALLEYVNEITRPKGDNELSCGLSNKSSGKSRNADVLTWCNSDVLDWLKENELIRSVNNAGRLQKLTGLHLLMFFDLKKESPDYYYSVLDSHLGFKDVLDTLEFTYALDRLLGSERLI